MSETYQLSITLEPATIEALVQNEFQLYAFKGVSASSFGKATIWWSTATLAVDNLISWTDDYSAYSANTFAKSGATITAADHKAITLGQKAIVGSGLLIHVTNDGVPESIDIFNGMEQPCTCGVMVRNRVTGKSSPICALPLLGGESDQIVPNEMVYFTFATTRVHSSTVVEQSFAPGILIDMTGKASLDPTLPPQVSVAFDINIGWAAIPPFMTQIEPGADLSPLLIKVGGSPD